MFKKKVIKGHLRHDRTLESSWKKKVKKTTRKY